MKRIVYRRSAFADLQSIAAYFDPIDPEITSRITLDIESSVAPLAEFPDSGELISGTEWRRIVTRKYHFTVSYVVRPARVEIIGIFRFQNRRA